MTSNIVTAEQLRELLDYNPATGEFVWLVKFVNKIRAGDVAGCLHPDGYRSITIDGRKYMAHRLAWLHVHGVWPVDQIDHRNSQRGDNRLINLRESTNSQNQQNRRTPGRGNTSGFLGVSWHKATGQWRAIIKIDGKQLQLGGFTTAELAHQAYLSAKRELHAHCTI